MFSKVVSLAVALLPATVFSAVMPEMSMDERYLARRALNVGLGTRYGDDCTEEVSDTFPEPPNGCQKAD